jgi:hypothetical protein
MDTATSENLSVVYHGINQVLHIFALRDMQQRASCAPLFESLPGNAESLVCHEAFHAEPIEFH